MTWVRVDDGFPDHPKVMQVGPLGGWLQICALAYCNRYLTDGFVPARVALRLADFTNVGVLTWQELARPPEEDEYEPAEVSWIIPRLVEAGMWERVEGGFLIHDFDDYQPSREAVLAERRKTADRVAKFRARKRQSNAVTNAVSNGVSNGGVTPSPTRPLEELVLTDVRTSVGPGESPERQVFGYWQQALKRPRSKLTAERRTKIGARLKEGYTVGDLKQAIDGVLVDLKDWPGRAKHSGLEVIFRNGGQVEKFMQLSSGASQGLATAAARNARNGDAR